MVNLIYINNLLWNDHSLHAEHNQTRNGVNFRKSKDSKIVFHARDRIFPSHLQKQLIFESTVFMPKIPANLSLAVNNPEQNRSNWFHSNIKNVFNYRPELSCMCRVLSLPVWHKPTRKVPCSSICWKLHLATASCSQMVHSAQIHMCCGLGCTPVYHHHWRV